VAQQDHIARMCDLSGDDVRDALDNIKRYARVEVDAGDRGELGFRGREVDSARVQVHGAALALCDYVASSERATRTEQVARWTILLAVVPSSRSIAR
jgi:ATP-dependent protease HslVU (ClpYQ) ATPase subunit